jgi:hypothetical protein
MIVAVLTDELVAQWSASIGAHILWIRDSNTRRVLLSIHRSERKTWWIGVEKSTQSEIERVRKMLGRFLEVSVAAAWTYYDRASIQNNTRES